MQASERDLQNLLELQEADMAALNAKKKLDGLPQRAQLQALAQKKQGVLEKLEQVAKMHDAARRKVVQVEDESAILSRKRDETQAKIDAARGDFRAVQSLTRDLDGIAKRLGTLETEQLEAAGKLEQIEGVKRQVESAIAALDDQALKIRDSFQRDAGQLKLAADEAATRRQAHVSEIDPALLKAYDAACRRGGGIGMARLVEGKCSTCRSVIDANRLLQVKREAPLAKCPHCGRLLIVK